MPASQELPDSLKDLVFRNAARVRPAQDFDTDIKRLISSLRRVLETSEAETGEARGRASLSGATASPEAPGDVSAVPSEAGPKGTATKEHPFLNTLGMGFVPLRETDVLFGVWETRVKDYQAFCDATGRSWEKPSFLQTSDHPAVNVSWQDATAFCKWLSRKEGCQRIMSGVARWGSEIERMLAQHRRARI
jgi:hypothetical protein